MVLALAATRRSLAGALRQIETACGGPPSTSARVALSAIRRALSETQAAYRDAAADMERMQQVLDGLDTAILVYGQTGELHAANMGGRRLAGGHHGDALVLAAARDLIATSAPERANNVDYLELAGPPRRVFELTVRVLSESDRLVTVTDITERRRLEEVRRDFVANISHELKTPVGAIALLTETLTDIDDAETLQHLLRRLHHEALRMNSTIEDLLLLSRIEFNHLPERQSLDLHSVVAEAAERVSYAATARSIVIEQCRDATDRGEPPTPIVLVGDRRQLVSAVCNLLDNAVKYSEDGNVVMVRTIAAADEVTIEVIDHGVGIPARDLQRVFERFYRVDRARSRHTGGTGLGLAIVRHVMENHGGEVRVQSREGVGSAFVLSLPAQVSSETATSR